MNECSKIYSNIRVEQNIVSAPSGPGRVYQTWQWEPSVRGRVGDMIFPALCSTKLREAILQKIPEFYEILS